MKLTKKEQETVNNTLRKRNIHWDQLQHVNCVRFHPKESYEHARAKFKIGFKMYKNNLPFLTEAWTYDQKQRFDLLNLIDDVDFEIEKSPSKKKYKGDVEVKI